MEKFMFTEDQYELLVSDHDISFDQLNDLPAFLKGMIVSYGWYDTEVQDRLYELGVTK